MHSRRLPFVLPGLVAAGLAIAGCAAQSTPGADEGSNDPFENTNRSIFSFNQTVDSGVLVPAAKAYRTVLPPPMQKSLHDFLQNLDGPVIFANDVLQGQPKLAVNTLGRLVINTTVGVGGMFDVAALIGIPYHSNDLGVTLANWGFAEGPYIMVPVLGPSNPRDLAGQVGDSLIDPGDYVASQHHVIYAAIARTATAGIDARSRNIESLADIEKTALDYYATIRSLYRQRREAQIRHENSNLPSVNPLGGSDSAAEPFISYTPASTAPPAQAPAK